MAEEVTGESNVVHNPSSLLIDTESGVCDGPRTACTKAVILQRAQCLLTRTKCKGEAPVSLGSCYHLCLCRGDGEVQKRCVSAITPLYACVSVCLCVYLYLCVYVFHKTFAIWLSKNYRNYEKNRVAEGHLKT